MGETRERDPWKRGAVDARVVFMSWMERPVALSDFLDCLRCAFHELREALGVVEVDKGERFVGENERGATVDNVMDQHLALSQAITKRLDFICRPHGKVVVSQPHARTCSF